MDADCLIHQYNELEKEYHEKHHKIEAWITSEGFVNWTEPVMKTNM